MTNLVKTFYFLKRYNMCFNLSKCTYQRGTYVNLKKVYAILDMHPP